MTAPYDSRRCVPIAFEKTTLGLYNVLKDQNLYVSIDGQCDVKSRYSNIYALTV